MALGQIGNFQIQPRAYLNFKTKKGEGKSFSLGSRVESGTHLFWDSTFLELEV